MRNGFVRNNFFMVLHLATTHRQKFARNSWDGQFQTCISSFSNLCPRKDWTPLKNPRSFLLHYMLNLLPSRAVFGLCPRKTNSITWQSKVLMNIRDDVFDKLTSRNFLVLEKLKFFSSTFTLTFYLADWTNQ